MEEQLEHEEAFPRLSRELLAVLDAAGERRALVEGEVLGRAGAIARDGRDRPPLPLETSRPGVFAAGDVRSGSIKRVASAVAEGTKAMRMIHQYLRMFKVAR